jgi:CelD/BcsL family acetyltransferase involved in cellulose biosynthesis
MSLTADMLSQPVSRSSAATPPRDDLRVTAVQNLTALADDWNALLRDGIATPYQSPAWVMAYAESIAQAAGHRVVAITVRDGAGLLAAVLPVEIIRRHGCTIAQVVGGKHANYQMPAMRTGFARQITSQGWQSILRAGAAACGGIDAFAIRHQPPSWVGEPNTLSMLRSQPSASPAYALKLDTSGEATLQRSLSAHARKKIRSKRNRFFELGQSSQWQALDERQINRVLTVFLQQKAERFAGMGIADPFSVVGMEEFLRQAARRGAIELHALELDGDIVSCYVGAVLGGHFSGMATSFAAREDLARMSPGEILLIDLIHALCLRGFTMFDLGVGEARYKATICDKTQTLRDSLIPCSPRGWLWCLTMTRADQLKRAIKASPRAMALLGRARRAKDQSPDQSEA